jgi:hypothetical protein
MKLSGQIFEKKIWHTKFHDNPQWDPCSSMRTKAGVTKLTVAFRNFAKSDTSGVKFTCKGKGKTIPVQAWTSPEGFRWLRLPDLKTIGT